MAGIDSSPTDSRFLLGFGGLVALAAGVALAIPAVYLLGVARSALASFILAAGASPVTGALVLYALQMLILIGAWSVLVLSGSGKNERLKRLRIGDGDWLTLRREAVSIAYILVLVTVITASPSEPFGGLDLVTLKWRLALMLPGVTLAAAIALWVSYRRRKIKAFALRKSS